MFFLRAEDRFFRQEKLTLRRWSRRFFLLVTFYRSPLLITALIDGGAGSAWTKAIPGYCRTAASPFPGLEPPENDAFTSSGIATVLLYVVPVNRESLHIVSY
jgi:hypothetical protein